MKKTGKTYYFIGIGGIGMSALAKYLVKQGNRVFGYDRTPSEITDQLTAEGVEIVFDDRETALPTTVQNVATEVIFTPAIPATHPQLLYFKSCGNTIKKRAVFLAEVCNASKTIAVAGTHGKTSTSAILTHLFYHSKQSFSAFLGGVVNGYNSNFISTGFEYAIVEADEFDRSFLNLHPEIAGVTSVDPDHLDIYKTEAAFREAFDQFVGQVSKETVVAKGLPVKGLTFAVEESADYTVENVTMNAAGYRFDLRTPKDFYKDIFFNQLGKHNLKNALCALALSEMAGISLTNVLEGLATFPGIKRRMNCYDLNGKTLIDDYAHHPTEIASVLETVQSFYPNKKNTVVFQPHLFSRTQDFMNGFATVLSQFDEVILLDIYPARELPIPEVDSDVLLKKISNAQKKKVQKTELLSVLEASSGEIVAVLGAGDVGNEVAKIVNHFQR